MDHVFAGARFEVKDEELVWASVMFQDEADGGPLSKALASKPDAMRHAREAAWMIAEE